MNKLTSSWLWVFFLVGLIGFALSNGAWSVEIMSFVFPICFLFILRQTSLGKGIGLVAATIILGGFLKYPLSLFLGFPADQLFEAILSIIVIVPFIIDRIFYPLFTEKGSKWRKFVGSLIFPIAFAVFELALGLLPLGIYNSIAVIHHENYILSQIVSLFGQPGLAFLVAWFASFLYFIAEQLLSTEDRSAMEMISTIKKPLAIFLLTYLAVFAFGAIRVHVFEPEGDNAKIALTTGPEQIYHSGSWTTVDYDSTKAQMRNSIREASASEAKLLLFNEYAFPVRYSNEQDFKKAISETIKENPIYVAIPIEVTDPTGFQKNKSKFVLFDPNGNLLIDYTKTHLIPFFETPNYESGPDEIPTTTLNLTNNNPSIVTMSLGYESSLINHMNTVGHVTDIHLSPTFDWEGLGLASTYACGMRAIEQGMTTIMANCVHPLIAYNYLGIPLTSANAQSIGYGSITYAYIPTQGFVTFYGLLGPVIDYSYIACLAMFVILSIVHHSKIQKGGKEAENEN